MMGEAKLMVIHHVKRENPHRKLSLTAGYSKLKKKERNAEESDDVVPSAQIDGDCMLE